MSDNGIGYVYILKDDHFKRGVKIGRAQDVAKRMRSLVTANPWLSVYVKIRTRKWIELEKATHNIIKLVAKTKQVKNSEFYLIEPEKAKKIMLEFARLLDRDDFKISTGDDTEIDVVTAQPKQQRTIGPGARSDRRMCAFSFKEVGLPVGTKLQFACGPQVVVVADEKRVAYANKLYTLSGFAKAFMPAERRCKSGAYQGPKYFTYNGRVLTAFRKGMGEQGEGGCWKNVTQFAKWVARQGGNEGAFGGILHFLSRREPCTVKSKWRKPLEKIGVKFDSQDFVAEWKCAKKTV